MQHPLEFVSLEHRRRYFFIFLTLSIALYIVFNVLDQPLRTDDAPSGVVSFELAGNPQQAALIVSSWRPCSMGFPDDSLSCDVTPLLFAAFGLGLDYLFMPGYALALAFGTLLSTQSRAPWMQYLGALAGYGALAAALFDAVENFALWQVLIGAYNTGYPAIAAACASIKFGLLIFGFLVVLFGWVWPRTQQLLH